MIIMRELYDLLYNNNYTLKKFHTCFISYLHDMLPSEKKVISATRKLKRNSILTNVF